RIASFLMTRPPPRSTPFPYTTLFRSGFAQGPRAAPLKQLILRRRRAEILSKPIGTNVRVEPDRVGQKDRWSARDDAEADSAGARSEEHTSELQSRENLVCRLLLEKKK